jgi:hypothetical protein
MKPKSVDRLKKSRKLRWTFAYQRLAKVKAIVVPAATWTGMLHLWMGTNRLAKGPKKPASFVI